MNSEISSKVFLILIQVYLWGFVLYYLFNGRKIEYVLKDGKSFISVVVIYIVLAIVLYVRNGLLWYSILMVLASLLYASIPSGFSSKGIFVKGKFLSFKMIGCIEAVKEEKFYRITITYKGRPFYLLCDLDNKVMLYEIQKFYGKKVEIHD